MNGLTRPLPSLDRGVADGQLDGVGNLRDDALRDGIQKAVDRAEVRVERLAVDVCLARDGLDGYLREWPLAE